MPKIAGLLPKGTKVRLHVTPLDVQKGCNVKRPIMDCAIARPVKRALKGSGLDYAVGAYTITLYAPGGRSQSLYPTDAQRMARFTSQNDRGYRQRPTSFTFEAGPIF